MTTGHEPIIWTQSLMTGVPAIDEQHRILVDMLNTANSKLTQNITRGILEELIRDLMSYAVYHFDTEEELMLENNYSPTDLEQHLLEHRSFAEKVAVLQQELRQGKLISREELLGFLNNWLIMHILKTDKKLGDFLTSASS